MERAGILQTRKSATELKGLKEMSDQSVLQKSLRQKSNSELHEVIAPKNSGDWTDEAIAEAASILAERGDEGEASFVDSQGDISAELETERVLAFWLAYPRYYWIVGLLTWLWSIQAYADKRLGAIPIVILAPIIGYGVRFAMRKGALHRSWIYATVTLVIISFVAHIAYSFLPLVLLIKAIMNRPKHD